MEAALSPSKEIEQVGSNRQGVSWKVIKSLMSAVCKIFFSRLSFKMLQTGQVFKLASSSGFCATAASCRHEVLFGSSAWAKDPQSKATLIILCNCPTLIFFVSHTHLFAAIPKDVALSDCAQQSSRDFISSCPIPKCPKQIGSMLNVVLMCVCVLPVLIVAPFETRGHKTMKPQGPKARRPACISQDYNLQSGPQFPTNLGHQSLSTFDRHGMDLTLPHCSTAQKHDYHDHTHHTPCPRIF